MTRAVGIDLGTTYTVVSVLADGQPEVIPNAEGQRLTPSVVAFTRAGRPLVGQLARQQAAANPQGTVFSIKRRMGSDYRVRAGDREYSPQEISSLILRKARADAQDYLGERVEKAVITVPAYFNERQRQATKEAGLMAGIEAIRILSEPTAAALAYGLDREDVHTVLVWDLGGGTFDVSVLELEQGIFEVRAVSGNTWLGGDDYDERLLTYLASQYRRTYGADLLRNDMARQRLREAAEKAKVRLSEKASTRVFVPLTDCGIPGLVPLETLLTRQKLHDLTGDLLEAMVPPTQQALADAGLKAGDIDRVILVGGATRMPAVRELAWQLTGKEPCQTINPDEAVALGAAIQAGMLLGMVEGAVLLDALPLSLGIETRGGIFRRIIPRNTPLPAREAHLFTTAADYQTSVDVHIIQGERALAMDNVSLGRFELRGVPSLPRGVAKIEVTFEVDVDGIVHVSADDLLGENAEGITIVSSKCLPTEEVQQIVREAEARAVEDTDRRERIQAGIQADNVIGAAEAAIEEMYGLQAHAEAEEIQRAVLNVKKALATGMPGEIVGQTERLIGLLQALSRTMRGVTSSGVRSAL